MGIISVSIISYILRPIKEVTLCLVTLSTICSINYEDKSLSQSELAATAGIDRSFLSEIEHGKANISISILEKLARALHVTMGSLLDDDGSDPEKQD